MTKKADIGSKRLISLAPENWVRWLTKRNDLRIKEFLSSEFQWVSRDNDVLLKRPLAKVICHTERNAV